MSTTRPGVPGMQQQLFATSPQQQLFNIAPPRPAKRPPRPEVMALPAHLQHKETLSPADLLVPVPAESLPKQQHLF